MKNLYKLSLVALCFAGYLAALVKVVVFKDIHIDLFSFHFHIPPMREPGGGDANLVPFKTILLYLGGMSGRRAAVTNLLGNVVPFLPIGVFLPMLRRAITGRGVLGFALAYSLGLETLQRVLHVGAFDVDDILLNTLGVLLGYGAFRRIVHRKRRWGAVWLRMTLWNVAVLALILGALGAVVRYQVEADLYATVDRTLAERAHAPRSASNVPGAPGPPPGPDATWPEIGPASVEGSTVGARPILPPIEPRILPGDTPWDRSAYLRARTGRTVYSTIPSGRAAVRVLSVPLGRDQVLQLVYPLGGVQRQLDALTSTLLALVPFGLLVAGLGGAFLAGRALRPVAEIAATTARLGARDLSQRLPVSGSDEFSELATSINAMLARLEEAFDRQRQFTADASHELRTPLSIIRANTSHALEHPWPEERYREFLTAIDAAAGRQGRIVEELLFLARADAGKRAGDVGTVCLVEALEEAVESVARPDRPHLRLESVDPALMVPGSGSELTRLFVNLLENAVRHTPAEGSVTVSASADAAHVTVTVADTGEGIAPEHLPHVTERFYRGDPARTRASGGTGLGLAICQTIVDAHGGALAIRSEVGVGTTVTVALPTAA